MAGFSLDDLPMPRRRFRIDRIPNGKFETAEAALEEDATRARLLRNLPGRADGEQAACNRLAARIEETDPDELTTLASAVVMRWHRIKTVGELWRLCLGEETYFVTLTPREFSVSPDELETINPVDMRDWLRTTLTRCGANSDADGWLFAYLEGDYNPATDMIQLHWHLMMVGDDMLRVVKRLRKHRPSSAPWVPATTPTVSTSVLW